MDFLEKLDTLMQKNNLNKSTLSKACNIPYTTIDGWYKKGYEGLKMPTLRKLADYFGTTLDYWAMDDEYIPNAYPIQRRSIPLLGTVSCGEPSFAEEDFQCYIKIGADVQADFALNASGDSMVGARIFDGDIVFVRRQPDVLDGQIAVVLIEDETLLKRVYKLSDGRIELRAENPKYRPIIVGGADETRTIKILGRAVALQTDIK